MIIDWSKLAPALLLLLVPIGLFHGKKVRFRPVSRDWTDHWGPILTLGLHWIDLTRAAFGGWLLVEALTLDPAVRGFMRYSAPLLFGVILITTVGLQSIVCKERDSAHAPFMFVTGLLLGCYPLATAGFPILFALTAAAGLRIPALYFPILAVTLTGAGYAFDGRQGVVKLALGACAVILPWMISLMFSRDLVLTYRARRPSKDSASPLQPHR